MRVTEEPPNSVQGIALAAREFAKDELEKCLFVRRDTPEEVVQFAAGTIEVLGFAELRVAHTRCEAANKEPHGEEAHGPQLA